VGLVETAASYAGLAALLRQPGLTTVGIGEVDLLADLGITRSTRTAGVIDWLRGNVVLQCAAAGRAAPIAPTSTDFRDLDAFAESTRLFIELGFGSRTAIHPSQVRVIHDEMEPSSQEVAEAADVLARYDDAGQGVALDAHGRLIDAAVVRQARRILSRSAHAPETPARDT
jgi:citrate lyase subunit beta/citryl-CoA lyase